MKVWLLVLLFVPTAGAQWTYALDVQLDEPEAPVAPRSALNLTLTWTVSCVTAASPMIAPGTIMELDWAWDQFPGADWNPIMPPKDRVEAPNCALSPSTTGTETVRLRPSHNALAFTDYQFNFTGLLSWLNLGQTESSEATAMVAPRVAFEPKLQAHLANALVEGEPHSDATFTVRIMNAGNGAIFLRLNGTGFADLPTIWPEAPIPAFTTAELNLTYTHTGGSLWNNKESGLELWITPVSADDETLAGTPVQVNALARTRGTPAAPMPLLIVGLALIAHRYR